MYQKDKGREKKSDVFGIEIIVIIAQLKSPLCAAKHVMSSDFQIVFIYFITEKKNKQVSEEDAPVASKPLSEQTAVHEYCK